MAKFKRRVVGTICKGKEGKGDYLKITEDIKAGFFNLESKKSQLDNLEKLINEGKVSGDFAETIRARIENIPDFVRFQIVKVEKE